MNIHDAESPGLPTAPLVACDRNMKVEGMEEIKIPMYIYDFVHSRSYEISLKPNTLVCNIPVYNYTSV